MSFTDKVVIVTGAGSGIGAAIALKFASEEAQIVLVDRNQEKVAEVAEKCAKHNKEPFTIVADLTNEDDVKRVVTETVENFGKIDILINNAGIDKTVTSIEDPKVMEAFDAVMATNLRATIQLTNIAVPYLIESKGNIINTSSIFSKRVFARNGFIYGCSKAALDHFAKTIAVELAPKGVRVNNVNPGPVNTDILINSGLSKEESEAQFGIIAKASPLRRVSEPEEIAELVSFLASDKAKSITGSTYVIDCGMILI